MSNATPSPWSSRLVKLVSVIGLAASIAAIASLYFQIKKPRRELDASIANAEHVSALPKVSGLSLELKFNGKKLDDFWITRVQVRNSGDVTLIAKGPSKNILSDGISLMFPVEFEILDKPKAGTDNTLVGSPPSFTYSLRQTAPNAFAIDFAQWRVGETVNATFYLARRGDSSMAPALRVADREIIDGDVTISQPEVRIVRNDLDALPPAVSRVARVMAIVTQAVLLLFVAISIPLGWTEYLKVIRWKEKHEQAFALHLNGIPTLSERGKQSYLTRPDNAPAHVWRGFPEEKASSNVIFSSWPAGLAFTACMLFLALSFAAGITALIY